MMIATTALAAAVVLAGTLGGAAAGCKTPLPKSWICTNADGGDPFPAATYNLICPCTCCTTGPVGGGPYPTGDCPWLDAGEDGGDAGDTDGGDAGQGGASSGTCTGECLPGTPDTWEAPQLLFIASPADQATCSNPGAIVYRGYGSVTTSTTCSCTLGWACQGTPSGTCPDGQYCSAFGSVSGALTCIGHDGDVGRPTGSGYSDRHVFYSASGDASSSTCIDGTPNCTVNPVQPATFCCLN